MGDLHPLGNLPRGKGATRHSAQTFVSGPYGRSAWRLFHSRVVTLGSFPVVYKRVRVFHQGLGHDLNTTTAVTVWRRWPLAKVTEPTSR